MSLRNVLLFISVIILIHSAYSTVQHKKYLQVFEKANESIPTDILVEAMVAFALSAVAIVFFPAANFKPIKINAHIATTTFDQREAKTDFIVVNNRARNFLKPE